MDGDIAKSHKNQLLTPYLLAEHNDFPPTGTIWNWGKE